MKEYTLWEDKEIRKEVRTLYEPTKEDMACWKNILNGYTVPDLQLLAEPILNLLSNEKFEIKMLNASVKEVSSVLSILAKKTTKLKNDWLQLVAFFLADNRNISQYIQTLSEQDILGWKLIIKKLYVSINDLKEVTGKDWVISKKSYNYYYGYSSIKDAGWFTLINSKSEKINRYGYREHGTYLFLQSTLRKVFAPLFFPEVSVVLKSYKELPVQGLLTFNGEMDFLQCYPILQALYKQDILIMGKNKMLATTIKKVGKQVNMKEFYEGDIPDEFSGIRTSMILPVITMLFDQATNKKSEHPEVLLKEFKNYLYNYFPNIIPTLLPDINGIKFNKLFESTIGKLFIDAIFSLNTTKSDWIGIDDVVNKLLIYPIDENLLQIFKPYQLDGMDLFNKKTGEYVHLGNLTEQLGIPLLKGLFFLMGGLGMLELAYEYPSHVTSSVFNTLQYVRLTELGKYALGLIPTYTPPVLEKKKLFHLDSNRLLIRSLEPGNPYESMLQDTALPIGNHLFIMSSDSFLKNCKTEKDVTDKIDFFKQFICQEDIPEIWINFFASLLNQCHPLKKISKEKYVIYQLDGNNKELIHLLTTDSVLKSIIVRAEGYMILVDTNNQKKLIDRLKTYGYLL